MDIATIVGMIVAITCLLVGIGSNLSSLIEPAPLIIVAGGTIGTILIANPLRLVNLTRTYRNAILVASTRPTEIIDRIVGFAETARRHGILALENEIRADDDPFLAQGTRLAVDGTEPDLIMDILETELQFIEERHAHGQRSIGFVGQSALAFGGIGAAVVVALQQGSEASGLDVASAAALPLGYGLVIYALLFDPIRRKLRYYSEQESLVKRMVIEGIMCIQSGDNPRIVEHKLSVFVEPKLRPSSEPREPAEPKPTIPPPVDEGFVQEVRKYGTAQQDTFASAVRAAVERSGAETAEKQRVGELLEQVRRNDLPAMTMLARLTPQLRAEVSSALAKPPPPPLVQEVAASGTLTFEEIEKLSEREVQMLLREVDQRDLVYALKGASQQMRDTMTANMSPRVRTFILEELAYIDKATPGEVFAAQARIVASVLELA